MDYHSNNVIVAIKSMSKLQQTCERILQIVKEGHDLGELERLAQSALFLEATINAFAEQGIVWAIDALHTSEGIFHGRLEEFFEALEVGAKAPRLLVTPINIPEAKELVRVVCGGCSHAWVATKTMFIQGEKLPCPKCTALGAQ